MISIINVGPGPPPAKSGPAFQSKMHQKPSGGRGELELSSRTPSRIRGEIGPPGGVGEGGIGKGEGKEGREMTGGIGGMGGERKGGGKGRDRGEREVVS